MTRVLIIDGAASRLDRHLAQAGMTCDTIERSDEIELADLDEYDALVFDLALGGVEIVRRLRAAGHRIPLIALAHGRSERVEALDAGADDAVPETFSGHEVAARVRAVTRRNYGFLTNVVTVGCMTVYLDRQQIDVDGRLVEPGLSTMQFRLLAVLCQNKGRLLSKVQLLSHLYSADNSPSSERIIDVMLHQIRKRLGPAAAYVITVHGTGHCVEDHGAWHRPLRRIRRQPTALAQAA